MIQMNTNLDLFMFNKNNKCVLFDILVLDFKNKNGLLIL